MKCPNCKTDIVINHKVGKLIYLEDTAVGFQFDCKCGCCNQVNFSYPRLESSVMCCDDGSYKHLI